MDLSLWLIFSVAYIGITFSPGPNVLIVLGHAAKYGFRSIFITMAGNLVTQLAIIIAIGFGVGSLLTIGSPAYIWMKYIGAAYLIYLGLKAAYKIYTTKTQMAVPNAQTTKTVTPPAHKRFAEAILVSASNPKTVIFLSAFLPQFITAEHSILSQFSIMYITIAAIVISIHTGYAYLLIRMKNRVTKSVNGKFFPSLSASIFVILGIGLGISA